MSFNLTKIILDLINSCGGSPELIFSSRLHILRGQLTLESPLDSCVTSSAITNDPWKYFIEILGNASNIIMEKCVHDNGSNTEYSINGMLSDNGCEGIDSYSFMSGLLLGVLATTGLLAVSCFLKRRCLNRNRVNSGEQADIISTNTENSGAYGTFDSRSTSTTSLSEYDEIEMCPSTRLINPDQVMVCNHNKSIQR